MKKTKSYRVLATFMAALMVATCIPQSGMYVLAQEDGSAEQETMIATSETEPELENPSEPSAESPFVSAAEDQDTSAAEVKPNAEGDPPAKPEEPVEVTSITFDKNTLTIDRAKGVTSAELKYTLAPNNATVGTGVDVTSSNEDIITVAVNNKTITVTAKGPGEATIRATTKDGKEALTAECKVTALEIPVKTVEISPKELTMLKGEEKKLTVKVLPENADNPGVSMNIIDSSISGNTITTTDLSSANEISVTAQSAGLATIQAIADSDKRIVGTCLITVNSGDVALKELKAKEDYPKSLYEGSSIELKPKVIYSPVDATDKTLEWSVQKNANDTYNPEDYAEVDQNGRVAAKWKEGDNETEREVTIRAAAKNSKDVYIDFSIKIKRNIVSLRALHVSPSRLFLEDDGDGKHRTVRVQLEPLASTDKRITATVSGEDGKTAVVVNAGANYIKDGENGAKSTATATADSKGWVTFTVTANKLADDAKQDTCTITFAKEGVDPASDSAITSVCDVTVRKYVKPVDGLELPGSLSLKDGGTDSKKALTAVIRPLAAEDKTIIWTIDDPEIASILITDADGAEKDITANGMVEAALSGEGVNQKLQSTVLIKANMVGTCKVTATAAGDVKKTCTVTVGDGIDSAKSLTITSAAVKEGDTTEITLKKGQTYTLVPTVKPDTAANQKVKWTSDSPAVASVEKGEKETGVVTANELGSCEITAQASGEAEACTKKIKVYVKNPLLQVNYKGDLKTWSFTPVDQPITEQKLREILEVSFYPRSNPIPDKDKLALGNGAAYYADYDLRIFREDGITEKVFEPEDLEKPGVKTLVISFTYDKVTYKDTVAVEMKASGPADLISIAQLTGDEKEIWNVPNATPAKDLPLPKTTQITVGSQFIVGDETELKTWKMDAEISWNVEGSGYDSANTNRQDFTVEGTVVLPEHISNPKNVSLRLYAQVHVREQAASGKKMPRPTFSVLGGKEIGNNTAVTLPYGSKIEIKSSLEDAEIYYLIDRRPDDQRGVPHDEAHQYKSPLEITAKTTTIYAIAAKAGYYDSECSECTIKLEEEEPVDPDDPNAAPLPDQVTDEDREQIGGKVPNGLWAVVQKEEDEKDGFAYTGKAIKPVVHVYDRTVLLVEKKDYTLAYSNNVNAGSAEGFAKPPTITVTGKGNYEGKAVVHFTIKPQSIEDDSVLMDTYLAVLYNGKAQKPNPSLTWNGKKLTKNKDYTYTDTSYTEKGIYKFTVNGIGNYTGSKMMDFEIFRGGVSVADLTVSKIPNQKYTGSQITPPVTVKYKNTVLFEGTEKGNSGNYWIKYENCTNVGNASVVVVGKGNYKGSKRINFKILPTAKISQAGIALADEIPPAGVAYTGKPYTPKCNVNYLGKKLQEGRDYKLSYQNNINAGKATVVITGMGAYTGTAKKTFKIVKNDISGLAAVMDTSYVYVKGGCKPKPEITCNGIKLKEGTDYTLSYKNHNKIGNTASVTVKGKGNYKGQIVRYFEVTMQDISKLQVVAKDKVYQRKKNIYKTKVQVIDTNGKALEAGKDYSRDIYYTYESSGKPVLASDIIPAGTVIGVDVRVANPRCYQGTVHGTYRIVQADVSGAKVSINPQDYTGRSVRLQKSQIQVTLKGVLLGNDDYEIVGYENNVNQGNAKITIRGVGRYGGTKTATFKIKKKGILNLKF